MPLRSRTVTHHAKPEKPTPNCLEESLKENGRLGGEGCPSPKEAPDKMGSMLSSITKRVNSNTLAAHDTSEPDEVPSRPGSASSRERAPSPDAPLQSRLLWPYVSSHIHDDDPESKHPLRSRRPALYEEYWADESD